MTALVAWIITFMLGMALGHELAYRRGYNEAIEKLSKIVTRMENLKK